MIVNIDDLRIRKAGVRILIQPAEGLAHVEIGATQVQRLVGGCGNHGWEIHPYLTVGTDPFIAEMVLVDPRKLDRAFLRGLTQGSPVWRANLDSVRELFRISFRPLDKGWVEVLPGEAGAVLVRDLDEAASKYSRR